MCSKGLMGMWWCKKGGKIYDIQVKFTIGIEISLCSFYFSFIGASRICRVFVFSSNIRASIQNYGYCFFFSRLFLQYTGVLFTKKKFHSLQLKCAHSDVAYFTPVPCWYRWLFFFSFQFVLLFRSSI